VLPDDAALKEGLVALEGMVLPTKDGYYVRGVIVDDNAFRKAIAAVPDTHPQDPRWILGAIVHVEAEIRMYSVAPAVTNEDGEIAQTREGSRSRRSKRRSRDAASCSRAPRSTVPGSTRRCAPPRPPRRRSAERSATLGRRGRLR
jgi:hypothetical protein